MRCAERVRMWRKRDWPHRHTLTFGFLGYARFSWCQDLNQFSMMDDPSPASTTSITSSPSAKWVNGYLSWSRRDTPVMPPWCARVVPVGRTRWVSEMLVPIQRLLIKNPLQTPIVTLMRPPVVTSATCALLIAAVTISFRKTSAKRCALFSISSEVWAAVFNKSFSPGLK